MENSTKNIIIAGVGGVAVGALLGILFAPAEGKKTRAAIKSKTEDIVDSVKSLDPEELLLILKDKVETKFKEGKSDAKDELLKQIKLLESKIEKA
jgi:gas vesicle protein